jgi:hypothetical protein
MLDDLLAMTHKKQTMVTNDQARSMQQGSQRTRGGRLLRRLRVTGLRLRSVA